MREIKFRVWDKRKNRFAVFDLWNWATQMSTCLIYPTDDYVFQQYTGLKDANSKEIYEGDIIQVYEYDSDNTNLMYKAEIMFDEEDAQFVAKELNRTYSLIIGNSAFCDINVFCCKVIGNIYETN